MSRCSLAPAQLDRCAPNSCVPLPYFRPNSKAPSVKEGPFLAQVQGVWLEGQHLPFRVFTNSASYRSLFLHHHASPSVCPGSSSPRPDSQSFISDQQPRGAKEVCGVDKSYLAFATAFLATLFHCKCKVIHLQRCFCGPIYISVSGESVLRLGWKKKDPGKQTFGTQTL